MRMVCRPPALHCQSAHSSCKEKVWGSSVVGSVQRARLAGGSDGD